MIVLRLQLKVCHEYGTPILQYSNTPILQYSNTPVTPVLQYSNIPTSQSIDRWVGLRWKTSLNLSRARARPVTLAVTQHRLGQSRRLNRQCFDS
jgi:hypothetical protein